ncbi:MAG: MMPL family transporter [Deltaproteobacteria bacterium]|nr:MMPL family transporter [Deltaproteobacteria bacterium]
MRKRVYRWLHAYPTWCAARPWTVLLVVGLVCGASLLAARDLRIVADLAAVLPEDSPSVRNLRLAAERIGSTEALYITAQSPDRGANRRVLSEVAAAVARWPERPEVFFRLDVRYFRDRALYYADAEDLQVVRDALERRVRWEKVHANPAYVELRDDPAPEIVPQEIREKYRERLGRDFGDPDEWFGVPGHHAPQVALSDPNRGLQPAAALPAEPRPEGRGSVEGGGAEGGGDGTGGAQGIARVAPADDGFVYLETDVVPERPGGMGQVATVLLVRFRGSAVNLDFARAMVHRADCLLGARTAEECAGEKLGRAAPLDPHAFHAAMRAEPGGAFRSRVVEADAIGHDVRVATVAASLAMALLILLAFRRLRALVYVLLPLAAGMIVCLGAAALLLGRLNVLTAFIFAVLMGLGIDFGIHLGRRYHEEREAGREHGEALARTYRGTGSASWAAMLTTAVAFATLLPSGFRAFSEFGLLCLVGLPASMLVAFATFPAVATLAERIWPMRVRVVADDQSTWVRSPSPRFAVMALVLLAVATAACAVFALRLDFDYDYGKLGSARSVRGGLPTKSAARGASSSPALVLADSPEEARAANEEARRRIRAGDPQVRDAVALDTFVPADQPRKSALLGEMRRLMEEPSFGFYEDRLDDEDWERLERWRERLRLPPVRLADAEFPAWARALFRELDGRSDGRFVYLMTSGDLNDGREALRLQERWQALRLPDGSAVPVASSAFVFADIIRHLRSEGAMVTGLAMLAVLAVLLVHFRRTGPALLAFVPFAVGFVWFLGLMSAFGCGVTFYSAVVFPIVVGTGIDAAIHLVHRWRELGPGSIGEALRRTGPAVALSTLTTAAGFASLMFTGHGGLASLGLAAVIGLLSVLAATLAVLPVLLVLLEGRRRAVLRKHSVTSGAHVLPASTQHNPPGTILV